MREKENYRIPSENGEQGMVISYNGTFYYVAIPFKLFFDYCDFIIMAYFTSKIKILRTIKHNTVYYIIKKSVDDYTIIVTLNLRHEW